MDRLAYKIHTSAEVQHVSTFLLNGEGTCACGRVLRKLDAKFILINAIPTVEMMVIAAYCHECSQMINKTLKSCQRVIYASNTETAPVEIIKKIG